MAMIHGAAVQHALAAVYLCCFVSVTVTARVLPLHPYLESQEKHISNIFDTSNYGILQLQNGLARTPQMGYLTLFFFENLVYGVFFDYVIDCIASDLLCFDLFGWVGGH